MAETFLMIVLTVMSGGQLSAAFSNAPTEAACMKSSKAVGKILSGAGYEIRTIGCYRSAQSFSRYEHGATDDTPRQTYLVKLGDGKATVTQKDTMAACDAELPSTPRASGTSAYCATSIQTLVK